MEGKYGRQVATLIRKGQFSTGSTKSIENITLEQVKAAAQNYSTFYLPQHQYSLEFHEDYARDKSLQLTANYTGPTYQSASGLRHQWSWREYIPFYWNVAEAQQEANRLATETVGPIAVHQASTFCMCCCRSRRLAKAKAKTQEIEREYNTKYEPIFTKNIKCHRPRVDCPPRSLSREKVRPGTQRVHCHAWNCPSGRRRRLFSYFPQPRCCSLAPKRQPSS